MDQDNSFAEWLAFFIERDGRTVRALSKASAKKWDQEYKLAHNTISRWLKGTRPRHWRNVLQLANLLRLNNRDTNQLLTACGYNNITELYEDAKTEWEKSLFEQWFNKLNSAEVCLPPFQAPPLLPTFAGREHIIQQLTTKLLAQDTARKAPWYCLEGMGGVGKTTLATVLAYRLKPHFPDGTLWAKLDQGHSMSILQSFAMAYGINVSQYTDLESRSSKVRELLAHKQVLIILDNVTNDQQVRPLLPPTGKSRVIITTRRRDLSIADEGHRIKLEPFNQEADESLALFSQIVGKSTVWETESTFREIANLLGHLPLALNIVANQLRYGQKHNALTLLAELHHEKDRLTLLQRGDYNVRVSFQLSYQKLPKVQQQLFGICGLFQGLSFSAEAVAIGADLPLVDTINHLQQLCNFSLLLPTQADRYQLHPLLRTFSRDQLMADSVHSRLKDYFLTFVQENASEYHAIDLEIENILSALSSATPSQFTAIVQALYPYWQTRGLYQQATQYLQQAEQLGRSQSNTISLAYTLAHLGHIAHKKGDAEQAKGYYQEVISLVKQDSANKPEPTTAHNLVSEVEAKLGAITFRQGNLEQAEQHYQAVLHIAQQQCNKRQEAAMLTNIGLVKAAQGEPQLAEQQYQQALTLAQAGNDHALTITILQNLGDVMDERGDYALAKSYYLKGHHLSMTLKDPELQSRMLGNLGLVACALGNHVQAAAYFRRGLTLAEKSGLRVPIARQLANLGVVATYRHNYTLAHYQFEEALQTARETGFPSDIGVILNLQGQAYLEEEKFIEAEQRFEEALQLVHISSLQQEIAISLYGLAQVAVWQDKVTKARRLGEESHSIFVTIGHKRSNEVQAWLMELPNDSVGEG